MIYAYKTQDIASYKTLHIGLYYIIVYKITIYLLATYMIIVYAHILIFKGYLINGRKLTKRLAVYSLPKSIEYNPGWTHY